MVQFNKIFFVTLLVGCSAYSAAALCERATPTSWLFPGPTCEQFISCSNGVEYIMNCPAGLHFSVAEDRCEWPHLAGCTGGSGTTTGAPPPPPTTTLPPPTGGTGVCASATPTHYLFPAASCSQFISCSNGVPHLMNCPAGLHFSVAANRCEWQDIAGCASSGTTVAPLPTTTLPPPTGGFGVCASATPTHYLFPAASCGQFISCSNGVPHLMNCPAGLHFSVAANRCEWQDIAGCASSGTTVAPLPTTTLPPPTGGTGVCASATPTHYLFPAASCGQFISCSNGVPHLMNCSAGLHFSVSANRCEWQDIAGCASSGTTTVAPPPPPSTTTSAPSSGTGICAGATFEKYLFPGPVCTQFYSCSNGIAYLFDCPAGLHFSVSADRCEWQDIAGCI